jgi:hypothetical protein
MRNVVVHRGRFRPRSNTTVERMSPLAAMGRDIGMGGASSGSGLGSGDRGGEGGSGTVGLGIREDDGIGDGLRVASEGVRARRGRSPLRVELGRSQSVDGSESLVRGFGVQEPGENGEVERNEEDRDEPIAEIGVVRMDLGLGDLFRDTSRGGGGRRPRGRGRPRRGRAVTH